MIKANELRIGNVTQEGVIKTFWEKGVHVGFGKCYEFDELNSIPLTEEILLKAGFETIENNWKVLDCVCLKLSWERLAVFWVTFENESICLPHIKYLHQLQNIFFALTNEELTINL